MWYSLDRRITWERSWLGNKVVPSAAGPGAAVPPVEASRTPNPDGSPGFIVKFDPEQRSFKQALIAIVFSALYLEALLYIEGTRWLGDRYRDRDAYEDKLRALGVDDEEILESCARFRDVRKDIVHEKASEISDAGEFNFAQPEAKIAVELVERITKLLRTRDECPA